MISKKIKTQNQLKAIISKQRKKKTIAFTNGCFDILHSGHVEYLEEAKKRADILIVGLNTDSSVRKIKGPRRPVVALVDRQKVTAALESVDYVTSFSEPTPLELISKLKPHLIIKGGDWKPKNIVGRSIVSCYGGKAISVKYRKGHSSTGILKKMKRLGR